jgi:hypothetical protein
MNVEKVNMNAEKTDKIQILELVDFQQRPKIKVNDMEKNIFKAFKHPKHPSFHEVIGPILAGFLFHSH